MRIAVLICCLGLAACTAAPTFTPNTSVTTPAVGRPSPPSSVQAATSSEAFTPYAELGQSNDDGLAPGESFSSLSKACLTDAGFPNASGGFFYVVAGGGLAGVVAGGGLAGSLPYGPWGYLGAEQDGFRVPFHGPGRVVPSGTVSGSPPAAEQKAMGKCGTIQAKFAETEMSGPLAGIRTLTSDIQADVQHDPSVKAATKAWSACMAQNGFTITDPQTAFVKALQAGAAAPGATQGKAQRQAEIALAVTDADCTESTDLAGIYFAVQASYEQQLVSANSQALNAAVQEYRADYRKELSELPKLLSTAKAEPFPPFARITCGCRKPTPPGDIRESRPRRDRAAGPGTDPDL